jgi:hypothetical protein
MKSWNNILLKVNLRPYKLKLILVFVQAAPFPCACFFLSFSILLCLILEHVSQSGQLYQIEWSKAAACIFFFGTGACAFADGICRYHEYIRVFYLLKTYGFRKKFINKVSNSRCQRDAALLAADHAGFLLLVKKHFFSQGYRWYHILPDPVADNPLYFFKPSFLSNTFLPKKKTSK